MGEYHQTLLFGMSPNPMNFIAPRAPNLYNRIAGH